MMLRVSAPTRGSRPPQLLARWSAAVRVTVALGLVLGCSQTGLPSGPPTGFDARGTWQFHSSSTSGALATQDGTVVVSAAGGTSFRGLLDVLETRPDGAASRRTGTVAGDVTASNVMVFDVAFDDGERRTYQGAITLPDSLAGVWIVTAGGAMNGTVTMHRTAP
jgi:hypothetical protein